MTFISNLMQGCKTNCFLYTQFYFVLSKIWLQSLCIQLRSLVHIRYKAESTRIVYIANSWTVIVYLGSEWPASFARICYTVLSFCMIIIHNLIISVSLIHVLYDVSIFLCDDACTYHKRLLIPCRTVYSVCKYVTLHIETISCW